MSEQTLSISQSEHMSVTYPADLTNSEEIHDALRRLTGLLDSCPDGAFLEGHISSENGHHKTDLKIRSFAEDFSVQEQNGSVVESVQRAVERIQEQLKGWRSDRFRETREPKTPLRILIVDDDVDSVAPLERTFNSLGCNTTVIDNGFEAVHTIASHPTEYDLVVMDVMMPGLDGINTLVGTEKVLGNDSYFLKEWNTKKLPVITFSVKSKIDWPNSLFFRHLDHWPKSKSFTELKEQASDVVEKLSHAET